MAMPLLWTEYFYLNTYPVFYKVLRLSFPGLYLFPPGSFDKKIIPGT